MSADSRNVVAFPERRGRTMHYMRFGGDTFVRLDDVFAWLQGCFDSEAAVVAHLELLERDCEAQAQRLLA